jgi:hypothetical protein
MAQKLKNANMDVRQTARVFDEQAFLMTKFLTVIILFLSLPVGAQTNISMENELYFSIVFNTY